MKKSNMSVQAIETHAAEILAYLQNLTTDIAFVLDLHATLADAEARGVDVGTATDSLAHQASDLQNKIDQIGVAAHCAQTGVLRGHASEI